MKDLSAKYAEIVIDCGGQSNPSLRAALTVSDRLIVPLAPRSIDAWALEAMIELIAEVRDTINPGLQTFILINRADPQGSDNDAVKELVRSQYLADDWAGIEILEPVVVNRKPFADAFGAGLSMVEHRPRDAKAIDELIALMAIVYKGDRKGMDKGYTSPQRRRVA